MASNLETSIKVAPELSGRNESVELTILEDLAFRVKEGNDRRALRVEALEEGNVLFGVVSHVHSQQHPVRERGSNRRIGKCALLHSLAWLTPIGSEVEHHRFALRSRGSDGLIQIGDRFDNLEVRGGARQKQGSGTKSQYAIQRVHVVQRKVLRYGAMWNLKPSSSEK